MFRTNVYQLSIYYKWQYYELQKKFHFDEKSGHLYIFKWNNAFLYTPFDAFFNSLQEGIEVLELKNDYF